MPATTATTRGTPWATKVSRAIVTALASLIVANVVTGIPAVPGVPDIPRASAATPTTNTGRLCAGSAVSGGSLPGSSAPFEYRLFVPAGATASYRLTATTGNMVIINVSPSFLPDNHLISATDTKTSSWKNTGAAQDITVKIWQQFGPVRSWSLTMSVDGAPAGPCTPL